MYRRRPSRPRALDSRDVDVIAPRGARRGSADASAFASPFRSSTRAPERSTAHPATLPE